MPRWRTTARPLAVQKLAAGLVAITHGLDRAHIGAICDAITAAGINPAVWSARAITEALNTDMKRCGWTWPDKIDRPGAFLAHRLRRLEWRPEGPPKNGGVAAAGPDKSTALADAVRQPMTGAQRERIAAAQAEIRAVLTGRRAVANLEI